MKRLFYYILIPLLLCSCSASYWSAESFSGDAMYDIYEPAPKQRYTSSRRATSSQVQYYTPYQRPDSYYQYQYISGDSLAVNNSTQGVDIEQRYVSSTYGTWDETPVIETYVYVESTPYVSYYDPFYSGGWGYMNPYYRPYWGYPYYGWYAPIYVAPRPPRPSVSRPKPTIVQRPSSSVAPSTGSSRGGSSSSRPTSVTRSSLSNSSSSRTSTRTSTPMSSSSSSTTTSSGSYR